MEDLGMYFYRIKFFFILANFHSAIYISMDKFKEALDAYKKAHTLDSNNENYKQSIQFCEERLNTQPTNPPNVNL